MARVDKRLDQLEKSTRLHVDELAIEVIEIWGLAEDGQTRYLMERWDLKTKEVKYYDGS